MCRKMCVCMCVCPYDGHACKLKHSLVYFGSHVRNNLDLRVYLRHGVSRLDSRIKVNVVSVYMV